MNGAIEVVGTSRVERADLRATVVTELHIVHGWCQLLLNNRVGGRTSSGEGDARAVVAMFFHLFLFFRLFFSCVSRIAQAGA